MKATNKPEQNPQRKRPPATTPEARENEIVRSAMDMAEEQILNRTASSQVLTHFLKIASSRERLEKEMLEQQVQLVKAKTEAIQAAKDVKELYMNALDAMRTYTGNKRGDEYDD